MYFDFPKFAIINLFKKKCLLLFFFLIFNKININNINTSKNVKHSY